jgi:hypothetical protein
MLLFFIDRWSAMAKMFPSRTDNDIKNKWYSMARSEQRVSAKLGIPVNHRKTSASSNSGFGYCSGGQAAASPVKSASGISTGTCDTPTASSSGIRIFSGRQATSSATSTAASYSSETLETPADFAAAICAGMYESPTDAQKKMGELTPV